MTEKERGTEASARLPGSGANTVKLSDSEVEKRLSQ